MAPGLGLGPLFFSIVLIMIFSGIESAASG